jgi:hypothetical protein
MLGSLLPKVLFWAIFPLILVLFRRMAPPRFRATEHPYTDSQKPDPLPTGLIGSAMWAVGVGLALLYFVLKGLNSWWASLDGPSILTQYPPAVIWCFFPLFAALAIPWPLTVWYLRKVGRWEEADAIEDSSDQKGGADTFRIMKWLSIGLVGPIGILTLLAIPIHLSISGSEVRVGHYASLRTERFALSEARRLTVVNGYRLKDGTFHSAPDVIIDFADGRRLDGNQVGDGGTSIRGDVMHLLIAETGLRPEHASTTHDIPELAAEK